MKKKQIRLAAILIPTILVIDQIVKILVKTNMQIGEDIPLIGTWCHLHFIENVGFAFGMSVGAEVGKIILTIFRIVASIALIWLIRLRIGQGTRTSLVLSLALIVAGAIGNIIDSCFYGLIFNESYYSVATLFPPEGGYAPFLQGKVVDMFYFPFFSFNWPQWIPGIGGKHFEFFNAVFNVADASITVGVILLFIDQLIFSPKAKKKAETANC